MKTKNFVLVSFLTLTLLSAVACENIPKDNDETKTEIKVEQTEHEEESNLELNDGKRWEANPETTQGVDNMIQLVKSFTDKEDTVAYKTLTDSLESEFTAIFQKCTMKGEAHNQLHNFLFPMKSIFKRLSSGELKESKLAFDELEEYLKNYTNYFE